MSESVRKPSNTTRRGFATLDPARRREIASKGGRTAHENGGAHKFTSEEAIVAGRKGGESISRDREHMAKIGRVGGKTRHVPKGVDIEKKPDDLPSE